MCAPRGLAAVDADKAVGNGHDNSLLLDAASSDALRFSNDWPGSSKGIVVTGAGTAVFLASADSDHTTGQVIMVDGGMVLV
jgi:NAD(P)-dependent dehydrogenase (short-subunit alcohol dehydrogenase family)